MRLLAPLGTLFLLLAPALAAAPSPAPRLLIPCAGSAAGGDGTFFRSDVTVANLGDHDVTVRFQWLPQGGGTAATQSTVLASLEQIRLGDFVGHLLAQSGLGAVLVDAVNADGTVDATARLFASARIWTRQPGTDGTTSQSFPVVPADLSSPVTTVIFGAGGVDDPSSYRVNVGIVNLDPLNAQTFVIGVPSASGSAGSVTLTVPPLAMQQIPLGSGVPDAGMILVANATPAATRTDHWTAYASTVNQTTGDAWSQLAIAP